MSEPLSPLFLPRSQILPLETDTPPSQESSDCDSPPLVSASPSPLPSPPNAGNHNITLNIIEEVIDLADRTNNLKMKVIDAFKDINCDNCRASSHGICRTHMTGNGVYNMRAKPIIRPPNPSPVKEEPMGQILRQDIETRHREAVRFSEAFINNLGV
tara:strand:+ start:1888 stop:2358 length:471 start_codon:yes stop_codon:yes gene_type:complete